MPYNMRYPVLLSILNRCEKDKYAGQASHVISFPNEITLAQCFSD